MLLKVLLHLFDQLSSKTFQIEPLAAVEIERWVIRHVMSYGASDPQSSQATVPVGLVGHSVNATFVPPRASSAVEGIVDILILGQTPANTVQESPNADHSRLMCVSLRVVVH